MGAIEIAFSVKSISMETTQENDVERMEKEKEEHSLKDSNTNCNDRRRKVKSSEDDKPAVRGKGPLSLMKTDEAEREYSRNIDTQRNTNAMIAIDFNNIPAIHFSGESLSLARDGVGNNGEREQSTGAPIMTKWTRNNWCKPCPILGEEKC